MTKDRARHHESAAKRIALVVRERRKRLGVTQQALARMAGCGLVFVYNIEHGKPSLRLDKLLDVLDVLGLELTVTAGGSEVRVATPPLGAFRGAAPSPQPEASRRRD